MRVVTYLVPNDCTTCNDIYPCQLGPRGRGWGQSTRKLNCESPRCCRPACRKRCCFFLLCGHSTSVCRICSLLSRAFRLSHMFVVEKGFPSVRTCLSLSRACGFARYLGGVFMSATKPMSRMYVLLYVHVTTMELHPRFAHPGFRSQGLRRHQLLPPLLPIEGACGGARARGSEHAGGRPGKVR